VRLALCYRYQFIIVTIITVSQLDPHGLLLLPRWTSQQR